MKSKIDIVRKKIVSPFEATRERGSRGILCNWVRDQDDEHAPLIDMKRYTDLLELLPDKIVANLEKGRLAHDGHYPMLRAGLGYEELLSSIIVSPTAIGTSSAEAKLAPALLIPSNYMAPGGIPGRTLQMKLRGRGTTLTTAGTITLRNRIAATDIITGTILHATGAVVAHATAQTNSQWKWEGQIVVQSVGSGGTVFAQGDSDFAWADLLIANQHAKFSGSAGQDTPAAATYDTTIAQFFQITGQWSLATAYSIQAHQYELEALN